MPAIVAAGVRDEDAAVSRLPESGGFAGNTDGTQLGLVVLGRLAADLARPLGNDRPERRSVLAGAALGQIPGLPSQVTAHLVGTVDRERRTSGLVDTCDIVRAGTFSVETLHLQITLEVQRHVTEELVRRASLRPHRSKIRLDRRLYLSLNLRRLKHVTVFAPGIGDQGVEGEGSTGKDLLTVTDTRIGIFGGCRLHRYHQIAVGTAFTAPPQRTSLQLGIACDRFDRNASREFRKFSKLIGVNTQPRSCATPIRLTTQAIDVFSQAEDSYRSLAQRHPKTGVSVGKDRACVRCANRDDMTDDLFGKCAVSRPVKHLAYQQATHGMNNQGNVFVVVQLGIADDRLREALRRVTVGDPAVVRGLVIEGVDHLNTVDASQSIVHRGLSL